MTLFEAPKKAIGLGFNTALLPYRVNRWAAGIAIRHARGVYQGYTRGGKDFADAIQLDMPAHNAVVGQEALSKVPIVEKLLDEATREVEMLRDRGAEPVKVEAAVRKRRGLLIDRRILRATGFGMIGRSVREIVHNDVPPAVDAEEFPREVATTVLDVAVESDVEPDKLDLPGMDKEIIAIRLARHKDVM